MNIKNLEEVETINEKKENYSRLNKFLESLNNSTSIPNIESRAENSFTSAVKFFELLDDAIPEEIECRKLKMMFLKSIRDNDYRKFKKAFRKYNQMS